MDSRGIIAEKGNFRIAKRGNSIRLWKGSKGLISKSDNYIRLNQDAIDAAFGVVLDFGLGLGQLAEAFAAKPEVTKVIVVEIEQDVIDLVWPDLDMKGKGRFVCADAYEWEPDEPFDFVFSDMTENDTEFIKRFSNARCWNG
jgi:SAM-dependent methyltransferase